MFSFYWYIFIIIFLVFDHVWISETFFSIASTLFTLHHPSKALIAFLLYFTLLFWHILINIVSAEFSFSVPISISPHLSWVPKGAIWVKIENKYCNIPILISCNGSPLTASVMGCRFSHFSQLCWAPVAVVRVQLSLTQGTNCCSTNKLVSCNKAFAISQILSLVLYLLPPEFRPHCSSSIQPSLPPSSGLFNHFAGTATAAHRPCQSTHCLWGKATAACYQC